MDQVMRAKHPFKHIHTFGLYADLKLDTIISNYQ